MDCGLNLEKLRGSLANVTGRTGIFESGRLDLDHVALVWWDPDLIRAVHLRSDGPDQICVRAAAELAGETFPAAARLGSSSEMLNPVLRGSIRAGLWPGMEYAACVIHLGLVRGAGRLGAACVAVVAGLRGGDAGVRACALCWAWVWLGFGLEVSARPGELVQGH